ncbi:MAG: glycosyl transferase family 1, partial [Planctomycetota bacterium]|nr:glycosyl transferase family 1 [Planctomycetota bacterium]
TDRCNIPEVGRYDAGTADPPDAVRLSASLREHVGDMDRRCTRGQNARRMAEECFALDGVVDRLEQLYEELAE